jgi:hypothetical protein
MNVTLTSNLSGTGSNSVNGPQGPNVQDSQFGSFTSSQSSLISVPALIIIQTANCKVQAIFDKIKDGLNSCIKDTGKKSLEVLKGLVSMANRAATALTGKKTASDVMALNQELNKHKQSTEGFLAGVQSLASRVSWSSHGVNGSEDNKEFDRISFGTNSVNYRDNKLEEAYVMNNKRSEEHQPKKINFEPPSYVGPEVNLPKIDVEGSNNRSSF